MLSISFSNETPKSTYEAQVRMIVSQASNFADLKSARDFIHTRIQNIKQKNAYKADWSYSTKLTDNVLVVFKFQLITKGNKDYKKYSFGKQEVIHKELAKLRVDANAEVTNPLMKI